MRIESNSLATTGPALKFWANEKKKIANKNL